MNDAIDRQFVLAVYPSSHGFAFVLFERPDAPFDWGMKQIRKRNKNAQTLEWIKKLVDRYEPEVLVFEAPSAKSKRTDRIVRLYRMLTHFAIIEQLSVSRYTRAEVRSCFATVGASTKYEIARVIANQIPAFMHRLPPVRKIWMSEDPRQSLFDAAALGIAHYARKDQGLV